MSERDRLLEDLVAEVLGPRGGPTEILDPVEDPVDEYITGVLAPYTAPSVELDADEELVGGPSGDDEGEPGPGTEAAGHQGEADPRMPSLVVDPMARPASMGVSVAVETDAVPVLDICCTWARYEKTADGGWQRRPYGAVWRGVDCASGRTLTHQPDPEVLVRIRSRQDGTGLWRISLFVVNTTRPTNPERASTNEHVFQPQIRICCPAGVRRVPLERGRPARDDEERSLELLYQDRPVLARGHLCSALWREVDPERPNDHGLRADHPPFVWSDGRHLFDASIVEEFEAPHVRSEFVPAIPVNAPSKAWPDTAGTSPELDPCRLAELVDGEALRAALAPLADAYERWIDERAQQAAPVEPDSPAERHLMGLRRAVDRLRDGIDLLAADDDARLSFCFANQAIALQSKWTKGRVNRWWPFQLAFQLLNVAAIVDDTHPDREVCDLLWFPTGGGKTEAYLGLAAFTLAHRRLRARREGDPRGGAGVAVLSRYTLRLLTIQQYRRALALVTACEFLRVQGPASRRGWRPDAYDGDTDLLWGSRRISIGLWAGGNVTPNGMQDITYRNGNGRLVTNHGAISILEGGWRDGGEPAQVLNCPACGSIVAIPPGGLARGETTTLHLVIQDRRRPLSSSDMSKLSREPFDVLSVSTTSHPDPSFATVSVTFRPAKDVKPGQVDNWIKDHICRELGGWLVSARGSRPGYFVRTVTWGRRNSEKPVDFEIFCPNPECRLNSNVAWTETTEAGDWQFPSAFAREVGVSGRCPIPAWTVDEQVYAHCPSMVVATVDKFARLAFEPRAGALFGNVDRFNEHLGYHRSWAPPAGPASASPPTRPREEVASGRNVSVPRFRPPELVLQDELHLIEGPLGSMVGIYEAGIDLLATDLAGEGRVRPKYVASTATVRQADDQVQSLFARRLEVFPPPGLRADESFFSSTGHLHPLDATRPGRLHVGVVAPGRGAQTPLVRIWSRLLQTPADRRRAGASDPDLDGFWTLVGYFNAIRELAGAVALARQDILQRLRTIADHPRELGVDDPMELSSRVDSLDLPGKLQELALGLPGGGTPVNAVVATSMFGTGVDVDRLGLMVVHGQPKTTSSYIQATGRVGRSTGGLVVTFYRASRPRDLSHYEYFAGYHTALYRHVEPVAVNPFAPRTRDRALGPLTVSILRQAAQLPGPKGPVDVDDEWRVQQRLAKGWECHAGRMRDARQDPDVTGIPELLEERASEQPPARRPASMETADHVRAELDRWKQLAELVEDRLLYSEPTVTKSASQPVVLGDLAHLVAATGQVYDNTPNSLRDVEATTTIKGRS